MCVCASSSAGPPFGDRGPGGVFGGSVACQLAASVGELALVLLALGGGVGTIGGDPGAVRLAFARFGFGALPAGDGVALTLLGDGHLAANRLDLFALRGDELRQLAAARVGGGAIAVRRVARLFGGDDGFLESGN